MALDQLYFPGTDAQSSDSSDEAAAVFGLRIEPEEDDAELPKDVVYLWPCNVHVWNAWLALQSQWRTAGMDGRKTGLDYQSVVVFLRTALHVRPRRISEMLLGFQAMEVASLRGWSDKRDD